MHYKVPESVLVVIHTPALALKKKLGLTDLATMSWVYPTLSDAIRQAALHDGHPRTGHVPVGKPIAILGDEDAGAASLPAGPEHGDDRGPDALDGGDALALGLGDALVEVLGRKKANHRGKETQRR